ncbi:MAG: AAA family ATPase [Patescibacteria group bacterium]|nr:AAA family ATPase [Patescibacteria group bacterium]
MKPNTQKLHTVQNVGVSSVNTQSELVEEIELLSQKVSRAPVPGLLKERLMRMIDRLRRMAKYGSYSGEFEVINKYVDWITSIPWANKTKDKIDLDNARKIMEQNHYGMNSVKELVLDYLAVMKLHMKKGSGGELAGAGLTGSAMVSNRPVDIKEAQMAELQSSCSHAPIICFVGLQGVGKTTMAKSIAQALGREFIRVSLGALGSVTQLRGQSRAYLDAEPGQMIKALVRCGSMNPVILLDEIDKVSGKSGLLADVMAALLEILDPEQNSTFSDHYIDFPIDLSDVMFVCTANNLGTLSAALLDRLEVIRFTSYSDEEKTVIAKDYLLPKVLEATALSSSQLKIEENVWPHIVRPLGFDAGIRQLERNLTSLCRHSARKIVETGVSGIVITLDNVKQFLPEGIGTLS